MRKARSEELQMGLLSLVALFLVRAAWDLSIGGASLGFWRYAGAGALLAGGFCLLVLERHFGTRDAGEWPEGRSLAQLLRLTILSMLLEAMAVIFGAESRLWPARLSVLAGVLPAVLAFEFLCRAIFAAITRAPGAIDPRLLADSLFARAGVAAAALRGDACAVARSIRHRPAPELGLQFHPPSEPARARDHRLDGVDSDRRSRGAPRQPGDLRALR